ncbi:hypothetical protein ACFL0F_01615 [Patescibacteria group bacterium]
MEISEAELQEVKSNDPIIVEGLKNAPIYKDLGEVNAQVAKGGEIVTTILADGTVESRNTAKKGDYIVTNPGKERYLVKPNKFNKRYKSKEGEDGKYIGIGFCKAITNPFGTAITLNTPWGKMNGSIDCKIAQIYCPDEVKLEGSPYLIGPEEFKDTYGLNS